ncbi:MAG: hypothetical protein J6Z02_00035, partial [Lachnospiraceae bacterium]|nr:hypothetical protein [Lachnospiraceae bacterium]
MAELKCPHCGQVFTVDGNELDSIVRQIRDGEFKADVEARVAEAVHALKEKHAAELKANEAEVSLKTREEFEKEINRLREKLTKTENENKDLQNKIENSETVRELAVRKAVDEIKDEKQDLERKLVSEKEKYDAIVAEKDTQIE